MTQQEIITAIKSQPADEKTPVDILHAAADQIIQELARAVNIALHLEKVYVTRRRHRMPTDWEMSYRCHYQFEFEFYTTRWSGTIITYMIREWAKEPNKFIQHLATDIAKRIVSTTIVEYFPGPRNKNWNFEIFPHES